MIEAESRETILSLAEWNGRGKVIIRIAGPGDDDDILGVVLVSAPGSRRRGTSGTNREKPDRDVLIDRFASSPALFPSFLFVGPSRVFGLVLKVPAHLSRGQRSVHVAGANNRAPQFGPVFAAVRGKEAHTPSYKRLFPEIGSTRLYFYCCYRLGELIFMRFRMGNRLTTSSSA